MTDKEAIEELKARKEHYEMGDGCEFLVEALEKGIIALDICNSMSKGIPYITVGGKIYKLTDERGE